MQLMNIFHHLQKKVYKLYIRDELLRGFSGKIVTMQKDTKTEFFTLNGLLVCDTFFSDRSSHIIQCTKSNLMH